MSSVLLVDPDCRSRFPPLGLMRISTFHKRKGDEVSFVRGNDDEARCCKWDRIYVASLFTYQLRRTVASVDYYTPCVAHWSNIIVGGIGATLMPDYVRSHANCSLVVGPLDRPGMLGGDTTAVGELVPDYSIVDSTAWDYKPRDAYFCRVTQGCIRSCKFCAVPKLEPVFRDTRSLRHQIREARDAFGERQNLVLLDNNVLATGKLREVLRHIREEGFEVGATRNGRQRTVDFNQGIDARLIDAGVAKELASIALSPVRLAFDSDSMRIPYQRAVRHLVSTGFREFTNYLMFNFSDTPRSLYERMELNLLLSRELGVRITGFPMRYTPVDDTQRHHVSKGWRWRYLRGIQCVLLATHGMVSPNPSFFHAAFGESYGQFLEILAMPDRYIIYRKHFENQGAREWRKQFRKLTDRDREEFLFILEQLNRSRTRKSDMVAHSQFASLLEHYYPDGRAPKYPCGGAESS